MKAALVSEGVVRNVVVLPDDWTPGDERWREPEGFTVRVLGAGDRVHVGLAFGDTPDPATPIPPTRRAEAIDALLDEQAQRPDAPEAVKRWRGP